MVNIPRQKGKIRGKYLNPTKKKNCTFTSIINSKFIKNLFSNAIFMAEAAHGDII